MKPGKFFEPVSLARLFSVATLLLWKLKGRCRVKWLWVESHFTTRLFRYAWRNNLSLIYGMAISLLFIWVNLKISILVIQEPCFANFLLKKKLLFCSFRSCWKHLCCVKYRINCFENMRRVYKTKSIPQLNTGDKGRGLFNKTLCQYLLFLLILYCYVIYVGWFKEHLSLIRVLNILSFRFSLPAPF